MASIPGSIGAAYWRKLGRAAAGALARRSLRQELGEPFHGELHRYGLALRQWSGHATRRIDALVSSYADAYRAQLNRMRELSSEGRASPELERDLLLLLKWNTETNAETAQAKG